MKLLVYIACPYSNDPEANVQEALRVASQIRDNGWAVPFVPVLTHFWEKAYPAPYETWMEMDFEYLRRCDAVLRLPGVSPGADREVAFAEKLGLFVSYDLDEIRRYCAYEVVV